MLKGLGFYDGCQYLLVSLKGGRQPLKGQRVCQLRTGLNCVQILTFPQQLEHC